MASPLSLYKALGLRVARFLKKILLLMLALVLVMLVLRFAAIGSRSPDLKTLHLFHRHSKHVKSSLSEGEFQKVMTESSRSQRQSLLSPRDTDEQEEDAEDNARKGKEVKVQMERRDREEKERKLKERRKEDRMVGQRQKGQRGGKSKAGKKADTKADTGVLLFYNASVDSLQPLWQEPNIPQGKRRNLTIVMYNLPKFVLLWLWNDVAYQSRCNVSCHFTSDLSVMPSADAVVFFAVNMPHLKSLPPRPPGQVWILWAHEGPNYVRGDAFKHDIWHHQINWTMNYRLDADFWYPYYYFVKRDNPYRTNLTAVLAGKTRMAAWIVSNCGAPSQRQRYVEELQKHVHVDVYGKCSKVTMDRRNVTKVLTRDYKFYLALENSLCKDYITEKALKNMQMADVVVVVRGGADYSKFLPKHSYIDASKFHSPKELAEYLKHLDRNPEEYLQYFEWKRSFRTTSHPPVCSLCLHLQQPERYRRTYPDVWSWYRDDQCNDKRQDF